MSYTEKEKRRHILSLQSMLRTISFADEDMPRLIPDGTYSEETAEAVRIFQRMHDLPETGETDLRTWQTIKKESEKAAVFHSDPTMINPFGTALTVWDRGAESPNIAILQAMLVTVSSLYPNLTPPAVSGKYCPETAEAVRCFQTVCGLPADGRTDIFTWDRLAGFYNSVSCKMSCNTT